MSWKETINNLDLPVVSCAIIGCTLIGFGTNWMIGLGLFFVITILKDSK
jgi:hypothetical protein